MDVVIIAAMAKNRVIGRDNALPWSLKEDMAHFRELTRGWPCIMGRKTWESLPKRPLPGRPNIVISRSLTGEAVPGAELYASLEEAVQHCAGYERVFICGGASVYREALNIANKIELTEINKSYDGDVFFPPIDPDMWIKSTAVNFDDFSFISYSRKGE